MTPVQKFIYAEATRVAYERIYPSLSADDASEIGYREAQTAMRPADVLDAVDRLFFTPFKRKDSGRLTAGDFNKATIAAAAAAFAPRREDSDHE